VQSHSIVAEPHEVMIALDDYVCMVTHIETARNTSQSVYFV